METSLFEKCSHLYPLSKTLRFELIPQGKTLEYIEKYGVVAEGESKSKSYQVVKQVLDKYHKNFIEQALDSKKLDLDNYLTIRGVALKKTGNSKGDEKNKQALKAYNDKLRKEVVKLFKDTEQFSKLFKKEVMHGDDALIFNDEKMEKSLSDEERTCIQEFKGFHGYFGGLNQNRENMYSDKEQSTSIAYRIVHENLPKFVENMKIFEAINATDISASHWDLLLDNLSKELNLLLGHKPESLGEVFDINTFNKVLTQRGIDLYNTILGGKTTESGEKLKGINEVLNTEYNQLTDRSKRIPKLSPLYKQILSDRESLSFLPKQFDNDQQVLSSINDAYRILEAEGVFKRSQDLVSSLDHYDGGHIYLEGGQSINQISQRLFGHYEKINELLADYYDEKHQPKKISQKYEENRKKFVEKSWHSLDLLNRLVSTYVKILEVGVGKEYLLAPKPLNAYFKAYAYARRLDAQELSSNTLLYAIEQSYMAIKGVLNTENDRVFDNDVKIKIKQLLDAIMNMLHYVKSFKLPDNFTELVDPLFYGEFNQAYDHLKSITLLYDKVRNYLTQKPYSVEKVKLNFNCSSLLEGWDRTKEAAYLGVLLRKDGLYFLALINSNIKGSKKSFSDAPQKGGEMYEKMEFKLVPGAAKNMPRIFLPKKNIQRYSPSKEILNIYEKDLFKTEDDARTKIIEYYQDCIKQYPKWHNEFNFTFRQPQEYKTYGEFCADVDHQGYKIEWNNISSEYVDQLVEEGKIYLFKIHSKDFSPFSKGRPNLHTMYWRALFDAENLIHERIYKLNGGAEVFFRRLSIEKEDIITHPRGIPIASKKPGSEGMKNVFDYELIKDKRFTLDKFCFHCPICANFRSPDISASALNIMAREQIVLAKDLHVIGLDRGERHLLYLNLINSKGEIVKQESLNIIGDDRDLSKTDYRTLLDIRENERKSARENWSTIENIKEIKAGYLSQVVHKIAEMMFKYNAIVVLEDLNFGFIRGRFKIEKQVYQKFEKALIDKLNYLVFKSEDKKEIGGLYRAAQLTSKFESFKKLGKQSGYLFYVAAANTSKIDPTTGFIDLIHPRYENIQKASAFFDSLDFVRYNTKAGYFEFGVDYERMTNKAYGLRKKWTICSYGSERFSYDTKLKKTHVVNVTENIKKYLNDASINYEKGEDFKSDLVKCEKASLLKGIIWNLNLLLSMRYSDRDSGRDFILSPVMNGRGNFFNSEDGDESLPCDADANGAYHIALKGLMLVNRIHESEDVKDVMLAVSNEDWFRYVQNRASL